MGKDKSKKPNKKQTNKTRASGLDSVDISPKSLETQLSTNINKINVDENVINGENNCKNDFLETHMDTHYTKNIESINDTNNLPMVLETMNPQIANSINNSIEINLEKGSSVNGLEECVDSIKLKDDADIKLVNNIDLQKNDFMNEQQHVGCNKDIKYTVPDLSKMAVINDEKLGFFKDSVSNELKVLGEEDEAKLLDDNQIDVDYNDDIEVDCPQLSDIQTDLNNKTIMRNNKVKYNYLEDHRSPLNPEGRKQYDRNFLYQFQFPDTMQKPALAQLECVLVKPLTQRQDSYQQSGSSTGEPSPSPDFTPGFILGTMPNATGRPIRRTGNNSLRKQHNDQTHHHMIQQQIMMQQQPRKIISLNIGTDIQLHTADNAWKLRKEELSQSEELYNKFRAILNKLTPQNFQTLIQKVKLLPMNTEERLIKCIDIIFEKAISEPNFSVTYANMARCLMPVTVPNEVNPENPITFRKLLITKCQIEFEKDKHEEADISSLQVNIEQASDENEKKQLIEEKRQAMWMAKRKSLGNIRFIGELFKLKMLKDRIMHDCLQNLISSNDEDNLECLCQLLATIGSDIETVDSKRLMDNYFATLTKLTNNKATSHRIRFMILDIIDLRKNNWVPRHEKNNPKTIEQIHQEAKQEELEKQLMIQKANIDLNRHKGRNDRQNASNMSQSMEDGWTSVTRPPKNNPVELSKIKISKLNMDDNIQLGPSRGIGTWQQGASGGVSTHRNHENYDRSAPNRYSALFLNNSESLDGRSAASPVRDSIKSEYKGRMSGPYIGASNKAQISLRPSQEKNKFSLRPQTDFGQPSVRSTPPPHSQSIKKLSSEEIEKKTKSIIDEFLQISDYKEVTECVHELLPNLHVINFIESSLMYVLDRTEIARHQVGLLFNHLLRNRVIKISDYLSSIYSLIKDADDMVIDVPRTWEYFGELISPIFLPHNVSHIEPPPRLSIIKKMEPPSLQIAKLIAHVLQQIAHRLGHRAAISMWKESALEWQDYMNAGEVSNFIDEHNLKFLVNGNEFTTPRQSAGDPFDELKDIFKNNNKKIEEVQDWIDINIPINKEDSNAPQLVSSIFIALCSSCYQSQNDTFSLDSERFKKFLPVIKNLAIDNTLQCELLFGLQQYVVQLQHPSGLLKNIFELIYDDEVVVEDVFHMWKDCTDLDRSAGKGVALSSVNQFFIFLENNDVEDS